LELTSLTPIFARMAVKAAKKAESRENINQFIKTILTQNINSPNFSVIFQL
jgi:hypothetical protein